MLVTVVLGRQHRPRSVSALALLAALVAVVVGCAPGPSPTPEATTAAAPPITRPPAFRPAAPAASPTVDRAGRPLPAAIADGSRDLALALSRNDLDSVRRRYRPADGAARWAVVAARLAAVDNRTGLLAALRTPPEQRPEVAWLFSSGDFGVGMSGEGDVAFLGIGQAGTGADARTDRDAAVGALDPCVVLPASAHVDLGIRRSWVRSTGSVGNGQGVLTSCSYYDNERAFSIDVSTADTVLSARTWDTGAPTYGPYRGQRYSGEVALGRDQFLTCSIRVDTPLGVLSVRSRGPWPRGDSCATSRYLMAASENGLPA